MKIFRKLPVLIILITLFASCQSSSDTKEILSKPDTRKEMMDKIANDSSMSAEMMTAMMSSNSGMAMMKEHQKMMMENHESMMKMMKDIPDMMQGMMSDMMEMCKNDSTMMAGMCKTIMANPQMMDMMQKMKGGNMSKMNAMDTTKAIDHKAHH